MNATTFDSLSAARRLRAAGLREEQAEAIAEALREASATNRGELATKADLVTKIDLAALEARLKAEMTTMANRTIATLLVGMGVLFAALKLF